MGNMLEKPLTDRVDPENVRTASGLDCAATGMQGWRVEMEDSHVICDLPNIEGHSLVAVFDGHGGAGAAHYASKNLVPTLMNTQQWKAYVSSGENMEILGEALAQAFMDVDVNLREHQNRNKADTSGCTAVCAVITPKYILCANAGDSRCVLGTGGYTKEMSEDHKPDDAIEKSRIERAGGVVHWKRVDGDLAVSRALGDFQYKTSPELHARDQKVTCYPDIMVHQREDSDECLILACDGVWDVLTSQDAVNLVRELFAAGENSVELVAEELVDIALEKGSRDNISSVIVKLPGANVFSSVTAGAVLGRRADREKKRKEAEAAKRK